jgi:hypothetical protein
MTTLHLLAAALLLVRGRSGARYLHDGLNAFRAR